MELLMASTEIANIPGHYLTDKRVSRVYGVLWILRVAKFLDLIEQGQLLLSQVVQTGARRVRNRGQVLLV